MKPVIYLRAASLLTLLHAVLHTIGGVYSKPDPGPQQAAVAAMKANEFPLMGATRSYWSFHMGLGLAVTILLTTRGGGVMAARYACEDGFLSAAAHLLGFFGRFCRDGG